MTLQKTTPDSEQQKKQYKLPNLPQIPLARQIVLPPPNIHSPQWFPPAVRPAQPQSKTPKPPKLPYLGRRWRSSGTAKQPFFAAPYFARKTHLFFLSLTMMVTPKLLTSTASTGATLTPPHRRSPPVTSRSFGVFRKSPSAGRIASSQPLPRRRLKKVSILFLNLRMLFCGILMMDLQVCFQSRFDSSLLVELFPIKSKCFLVSLYVVLCAVSIQENSSVVLNASLVAENNIWEGLQLYI